MARSAKRIDNGSRTRTSDRVGVAAEHCNTRAKLGAAERDHVLADMDGHLLALMGMSVHQDPLNEIIAVLVPRNVDEWNARTICTCGGDDAQVPIQELVAADLETFFNDLGGKLIDAVVVGVAQDVIDNAALVRRGAVLAEVLDAPVAELTMSNEINVGDHLFDGRALLVFNAVLEDVLNHETAGLTKSDLMPHSPKSLVDLEHDLRGLTAPAELE